jgi:uroporphyrinogen decarboxylase
MNGRERIRRLAAGEPTDRRPFGAILSLYGAGLTGCPLERYYNDAEEYARGQDAVRQTIGPDFLTGPFLLAGFGEAFGSTLFYADNYVPNLLRPAIRSAEGIPGLKAPDLDAHPRILFFRDSIRRMAAAHGKDALILGIVLSPLDLPLVIMGIDAWLLTVLTDAEGTRRMLDLTTPFFVRLCAALRDDGADAIVMPMTFFTRDIATGRMVRDFAMPALREALRQVKGPVVFHHTGSTFLEHLDLLDTLPGAWGFTLDVHDDIADARRRVRKEAVLFAGFDGPTLHTLQPAEIRARCLELLWKMRNDGAFVPAATGTDVDLRTPVDRLLAIRRALEEFQGG